MNREYYFCCCLLDKKTFYFIWFSDEEDGVFLTADGKIAVFEDLETLSIYTNKQIFLIKGETPVFFNLEKVEETLKHKIFLIDCVEFLNTWNLFEDISRSVGENFNSDRKATKKIYEKLFWGNNLPAVTPEGKVYEPIWNKKEIEIIRDVLFNGFTIFRSKMKYISNEL